MPAVSVLIPTYNAARHVRVAIDSVLAQRDVDLELIICDDSSRDDTVAIASSYADPRVRIERNPVNLGMGGNWNRVLGLASGTYVKLLPDDDYLMPGALARQVAVLETDQREEIALVFGARELVDGNGRRLARRAPMGRADRRISGAALARDCVRRGTNMIGEPGAVLFRRALAARIGPFDGSLPFVVDVDYWLRLLAHGDACYLADPISAFRLSTASFSVALGKGQTAEYHRFLARAEAAGLVSPSLLDRAMGRAATRLNSLVRRAFYALVVR